MLSERHRPAVPTAMFRLLIAPLLAFTLPSVQATEYVIDPTHTYASFEIDHLGFSTQRGQFNRSSGSIEFDPVQQSGRIDIRIDAASLDLSAVDGTLVMRGAMRPLRLEVTRFKCGFNLANRKRGCGADAVASLKRSDFGLNNGLPFIGDEVRLRIQVEAYLP